MIRYSKYLVLLFTQCICAQISGVVRDDLGTPIAYATIFVEETNESTISNANGRFNFPKLSKEEHKIWAQHLSYNSNYIISSTDTKEIEIVLKAKDDPKIIDNSRDLGKQIIKKVIHKRKQNANLIEKYTASFYSNGSMEILNFPKKIIGYDIQQLDPNLKLDSLRNKYVYKSELISEVEVEKPHHFKEIINAHKTKGEHRGSNFQTAFDSNFDFYENESYRNWKLISPISNSALAYYKYQLVDEFVDTKSNKKIYKIKVSALRNVDPVVDGFLYVCDESFQIYAVDFIIKGTRASTPQVQEYAIKQQFVYNHSQNVFLKQNQQISFSGKIFVFKYRSDFYQLYNNWNLAPTFEKKHFTNELITYSKDSNIEDPIFWDLNRPLTLTHLEASENISQDQSVIEKGTQHYQDSLDRVNNRFNPIKLIIGYKYRNSYKNETYKYNGLLSTFAFNAVQGFNVTTGVSYLKEQPKEETFYEFGGLVNYGIAENKPRFSGYYSQLFNRKNYAKLDVSGGAVVHQFGEEFPIKKLINSLGSSYFGKNFAKFYKKEFVRFAYEQELFNGMFGKVDLEYANRLPLFNNTINSPFVKNRLFSSNNPLNPEDYENAGFEANHIFKLRLKATYHIGQKYISYPHKKINVRNSKYPSLTLSYENGFGSNNVLNNYSLLGLATKYETSLGILGNLGVLINGGKFFNADAISFMDYKHFYGNETFIGTNQSYLGKFNLMPYYSMSTNKDFIEWHAEHNFKGYVINKIPLIRSLKYQFVVGAHAMYTNERKPYYEYSIGLDNVGFGTFRPFRIDYFRSYHNGKSADGIVIGIKLLDRMN